MRQQLLEAAVVTVECSDTHSPLAENSPVDKPFEVCESIESCDALLKLHYSFNRGMMRSFQDIFSRSIMAHLSEYMRDPANGADGIAQRRMRGRKKRCALADPVAEAGLPSSDCQHESDSRNSP